MCVHNVVSFVAFAHSYKRLMRRILFFLSYLANYFITVLCSAKRLKKVGGANLGSSNIGVVVIVAVVVKGDGGRGSFFFNSDSSFFSAKKIQRRKGPCNYSTRGDFFYLRIFL